MREKWVARTTGGWRGKGGLMREREVYSQEREEGDEKIGE